MPRIALVLCLAWFILLFVVRSLIQWKRTGSTGVKGFRGGVGSLPWWAGIAASAGLVLAPLAPLAPLAALRGWPGGALWLDSLPLQAFGLALATIGIVGSLLAQLSMGESWRIGVDEAERTELVTGGLFATVRNPIFSFIALSVAGLGLLVPNAFTLASACLTLFGIEAQVRGVEEPYLLAAHGDRYRRYAARVGRFVLGVGRLRID